MKRSSSLRRRGRLWRPPGRGAAAVEFAATLPLLTVILLGATDFGRFAHTLITVTSAARAGAAFGSTHPYTAASRPAWESGIRQAVSLELERMNGFNTGQLVVTIAPATDSDGRGRVAVDVAYPFRSIISWGVLPDSLRLKQRAVFPMTR